MKTDTQGKTSYDIVKEIIGSNSAVKEVSCWAYCYVPLQTNENIKTSLIWVEKEKFLEKNFLNSLKRKYSKEINIGMSSKVLLDNGEYRHIPMMDFSISKNKENLKLLIERLQHLEFAKGYIVETGSSYHYFGKDLITVDDWYKFLGKCLLSSVVKSRDNIVEIADNRYIGHSLRRGDCSLRLTSRADKTFIPKVVYEL